MTDFRLETERLILRDWRDADLDALAAMGQDPQVMATLGPLLDREQSADLLERLRAMAAELGHTFWALERKADGRMIGFTGIIRGRDGPVAGKLEIGWRLASDCWGEGYASEAARAAIGWAAANRPGEDVYAITNVTNARSRAVMERLGMAYEPGLDFAHPRVADDSSLKPHVTYRTATGGDLTLHTARLLLRAPRPGDAELQFRHLNSPEVTEHLGGPRTLDTIAAKLDETRAQLERDGFGYLMIEERATGELVGYVGLKRVDNPHAANPGDMEIGWLVREDRWRRGYASEAVRAMLEFAFERCAAPVVVALTAERNEPSWRLMERLGMARRSDLDFDDPAYPPEDNPTIVYVLTRAKWNQHRKQA